jgi:ribosome production factor 1
MSKNPNEFKNKNVRQLMYRKLKQEKLKTKKKTKLENKDKPKQVPKTIENCRIKDETFVGDLQNDPEIQLDLRTDELSKHLLKGTNKANRQEDEKDDEQQDEYKKIDQDEYDSKVKQDRDDEEEEEESSQDEDESEEEEENNDPKILITTTEMRVAFRTYKMCRELSRILPNAHYFFRKNVRMSKVIPEAIKRKYSAIIAINEDHKEPNGMMITLLPEGPTMNFKLSNVKLSDEIKHANGFKGSHNEFTKHKPEIILNNFNTRLGLQLGRSFAALFPHDPQYLGRHCCTFHNQRDFVFFRHHRYIFRNAEKVGLQELGPRFTLKLRSLQKGAFNSKFGEYEWVQKRHEMESNRRKFSI